MVDTPKIFTERLLVALKKLTEGIDEPKKRALLEQLIEGKWSNEFLFGLSKHLESPSDSLALFIGAAESRKITHDAAETLELQTAIKALFKNNKDLAIPLGTSWQPKALIVLQPVLSDGYMEQYCRNFPFEYLVERKLHPTLALPNIELTDNDLVRAIEKNPNLSPSAMRNYLRNNPESPIKDKILDGILNTEDGPEFIIDNMQYDLSTMPGGNTVILRALERRIDLYKKYPTDTAALDILSLTESSNYKTLFEKPLKELAQTFPAFGFSVLNANPEGSLNKEFYKLSLANASQILSDPEQNHSVVVAINALHERPAAERFACLEKATATQLYDLMSSYKGEFFTSSFNGVFDRFTAKLKAEGKTLSDIVMSSETRQAGVTDFMESVTTYNRTSALYPLLSNKDTELIVDKMFHKKDENSTYNISAISSVIKAIPTNHPILPMIQKKMISEYTTGNEYTKAEMAILASWYTSIEAGKSISPENKPFFDKIASNPIYKTQDISVLKNSDLVDKRGTNYQVHIFYNDKDGQDTYNSFHAAMKADGWSFQDKDGFQIVSKEKGGRRVEMLVGLPQSNGDITNLKTYMDDKGVSPSILMHRGHSYHVDGSLQEITEANKLVFLGSCGGHSNVIKVLEKSPQAHILSTSGTGRMDINNRTLVWLNQQILSGKDIEWSGLQSVWDKLRGNKDIGLDAESYIAPHKNLTVLFEMRMNEIFDKIYKAEFTPEEFNVSPGSAPTNGNKLSSNFGNAAEQTAEPPRSALTDEFIRKATAALTSASPSPAPATPVVAPAPALA